MWVQLDFDIIDLTFTKDNVSTIIPVVMNPIDIAADADAPVYTTDDSKGLSWWQIPLKVVDNKNIRCIAFANPSVVDFLSDFLKKNTLEYSIYGCFIHSNNIFEFSTIK